MMDSTTYPTPEKGQSRWTQPSVLLVATDLSDLEHLMPFAFSLAVEAKMRLILLHVIASPTPMSVDSVGMPYYDSAGAFEFAAKTLEPWCTYAHRMDVVCDALVREGQPARQIEDAVRQFSADRVLLGTRSRGKLGRLLLGSVAEQVLRSVTLPVFTVGPEAHLPVETSEPVVLYATTLRETSRPSAALACQIAENQGARLVLLHVLPPLDAGRMDEPTVRGTEQSGPYPSLDSAAMHELRLLAAQTGAGRCTAVEPRVVHGNPAIEILAEAAERHAGLIVLGASRGTAFENLTRDRTIYRVLAHACCPVLTLREPQAKQDQERSSTGSDLTWSEGSSAGSRETTTR